MFPTGLWGPSGFYKSLGTRGVKVFLSGVEKGGAAYLHPLFSLYPKQNPHHTGSRTIGKTASYKLSYIEAQRPCSERAGASGPSRVSRGQSPLVLFPPAFSRESRDRPGRAPPRWGTHHGGGTHKGSPRRGRDTPPGQGSLFRQNAKNSGGRLFLFRRSCNFPVVWYYVVTLSR